MPSRLTGVAKEAQAHCNPHGVTQSQPTGEREEEVVPQKEKWNKPSSSHCGKIPGASFVFLF